MTTQPMLHKLKPGAKLPNDWYNGLVPLNIDAGQNVMIESAFSFQYFHSSLPVALKVGNNVTLWRTAISTEVNGYIEIGDDSYLTNASIVCAEKITIGKRVFIAGGVTIPDSDFHPLAPAARLADTIALSPVGDNHNRPFVSSKPVIIEDDVWIGFNATILKGVQIGEGAVIQPGAVVINDVPAKQVVAGNPARSENLNA